MAWDRTICLASAALLLAGCLNPEPMASLPLEETPPFSRSGDVEPPERWWREFGDAELDRRIERALEGNFSLAAAWQRLRAARALARREASDLWPDLDALASARWSEDMGDGGDDDFNGDGTEFRIGLEVSYELDLWGRIESRVEARRVTADATLAAYRAAALSLAANVTQVWYRAAAAHRQLEILERQIDTNAAVVELLETRFAAGQIRSADVLRQRQLVEATREQAVVQRSRLTLLGHQLSVLLGEPPQGMSALPPAALPELPPLPRTGVPGELVRRRPDVQQARLRLEAADREVASAVADQYPRIDLTASLIATAEDPEHLFEDWLASLAGQLVAPLFDAGQRRAEVRRAQAVTRERLADYGDAVLLSFREVEDALASERFESRRLESLTQQLDLARQTLDQLRTQYLNGVTDYIAVLTALTDVQRLERARVAARLAVLESRIGLYRALAGGFETPLERAEKPPGQATKDDHDE